MLIRRQICDPFGIVYPILEQLFAYTLQFEVILIL